ncbi:MAG: glycosyltransferase [Phycisphaerae bacterium]|jgi:glycosyltransferase involved in cell wall biosynthesis
MTQLISGRATIGIIQYKTLDFTKLCLRSIRKFTSYPYDVIVVDNDSADESLEYLRGLKWIKLIERKSRPDEPGGGYAHAAALDLAMDNCNTEFFVSLHSDVFVKRAGWLGDLVRYFNNDEKIACVGTGKIELQSDWLIWLKENLDFKAAKRKLFREPDPLQRFRYFNRTIYSIYRTDVLRRERLNFLMGKKKGMTAGRKLYFDLLDRGYKTVELPQKVVKQYVVHLAHATQAVNPQEFLLRKRTLAKYKRQLEKVTSSELFAGMMTDTSLDK